MKPVKHWLLLGAAALLLLTAVAVVFLNRQGDRAAVVDEVSAADLRWREGRSQVYDVSVDSSFLMTMPGAGAGQSMSMKLEGVLAYYTLGVDSAEVSVGMQFSSIEMSISGETDPDVNRALTTPFKVRFTPDGHPLAFEFPAELTGELREVIENLVRMFQVTMRSGDTWVVRESNASGRYEALYTRTASTLISKHKQRYIAGASANSGPPTKVTSEESIRIEVDRDWIAAMSVDETLITSDASGPSVEVTNRANLSIRPAPGATPVERWNFVATARPLRTKKPSSPADTALSPEEAERQLRAGVTSLDGATKGRSILIHRLRDLLLVDGELPFRLLDMMRTEDLTDRTRADLYLAFELAGTAEAQAALASVITDGSWPSQDGLRAIVALGGLAHPTEDTLSILWDTARAGMTGSDQDDLSGTAALALGSLGQSLRDADDVNYASLRADLLDGASSASTDHQRATFLHALGNTQDPDPLVRSDIVPFLEDPAPEVRSAAARTIGRLGVDQVGEDLLRRFEREESDMVRGSIAEALAAWEDPPPPAMESIRAAIPTEPDEKVRYNMAILLANSMEAFPENRAVLEQLMTVEQSKRIIQQVSETLYAPR